MIRLQVMCRFALAGCFGEDSESAVRFSMDRLRRFWIGWPLRCGLCGVFFVARLAALLIACSVTDSLVEIIIVFAAANAFMYWILTGWIFILLKRYVWQSLFVSAGTFAVLAYLVVWLREILG